MPNNPLQRDLARIGIPFPDFPLPPKLPVPPPLAENPSTPLEALTAVPTQAADTVVIIINTLLTLPLKVAEDGSVLVSNVLSLPEQAVREVIVAPKQVINTVAPKNLGALIQGLLQNLQFQKVSPAEFQQRLRTITDIIPFV